MVGTYALSLLWPWGSVPGRGTKIPASLMIHHSPPKKKICYIHMNGMLTLKKKGILRHAVIGMNLEDITIREINGLQNDKYYMIVHIRALKRAHIRRTRM